MGCSDAFCIICEGSFHQNAVCYTLNCECEKCELEEDGYADSFPGETRLIREEWLLFVDETDWLDEDPVLIGNFEHPLKEQEEWEERDRLRRQEEHRLWLEAHPSYQEDGDEDGGNGQEEKKGPSMTSRYESVFTRSEGKWAAIERNARHDDWSQFYVRGHDLRVEVRSNEAEESQVVAVHATCLALQEDALRRVGYEKGHEGTVRFSVLARYMGEDMGEHCFAQGWEKGREDNISDPMECSYLEKYLLNCTPLCSGLPRLQKKEEPKPRPCFLTDTVTAPLERLPGEILTQIAIQLPISAILPFLLTSRALSQTPLTQEFWHSRFTHPYGTHAPLFEAILNDHLIDGQRIDWKRLFEELNKPSEFTDDEDFDYFGEVCSVSRESWNERRGGKVMKPEKLLGWIKRREDYRRAKKVAQDIWEYELEARKAEVETAT